MLKTEKPLEDADELPQYSPGEITQRARDDMAFDAVIKEAQKRLGKMLSGNDQRILLGIYDHLGIPADVLIQPTAKV